MKLRESVATRLFTIKFVERCTIFGGAFNTIAAHRIARGFPEDPVETGTSISATDRNTSNIYLATLELPGGIVFENIEIWDVDLEVHNADIVIGMDIISQGRLVVETVNGIPMFSFEIEQ